MKTIQKVIRTQWQTWLQHIGILALTVGVDLRLGLHPWLTFAAAFVMLVREIVDAKHHDDAGDPIREWGLDFILDWLTVIIGIGLGAWIYG